MGIWCVITLIVLLGLTIWGIDKGIGECFFACIVFLLVLWGVSFIGEIQTPDAYYENSKIAVIHNLKTVKYSNDVSGHIQGSLFYIDGFIKTEDNYRYYVNYGNHHYRLEQSSCDKTVLIETKGQPKVINYYYTKGYIKHSWVFRFFHGGDKIKDVTGIKEYIGTDLYIPEGTIISDFTKVNL